MCLDRLMQTLKRVWSSRINFQILPNSLSLSLVFASGYLNTSGHFLFLKYNIVFQPHFLSTFNVKPGLRNRWKSMIGKPINKSKSIDSNYLIDIDWYLSIDSHKNLSICQSMTIDCYLNVINFWDCRCTRLLWELRYYSLVLQPFINCHPHWSRL